MKKGGKRRVKLLEEREKREGVMVGIYDGSAGSVRKVR